MGEIIWDSAEDPLTLALSPQGRGNFYTLFPVGRGLGEGQVF